MSGRNSVNRNESADRQAARRQRWIGIASFALLLVCLGAGSAFGDDGEKTEFLLSPEEIEQTLQESSFRLGDPETDPRAAEELPHEELGREGALELLSSVFGSQLEEPAGIFDELDVHAFRADNVAVIDNPGAEPTLLDSSLPLRTKDSTGQEEIVDLELESVEGELQPANPLVEVSIPAELGDGISLPESGIVIEVVGAPEERAPSTVAQSSTAFYPNIAPDTDLTVAPTPTGVETLTHLRSPDAPHSETFHLSLPQGASLSPTSDGGATVERAGETILSVLQPSALDAEGDPVDVTMTVSGDSLVLETLPDSDTSYPILVDPIYESYYWANNNNPSGIGDWTAATNSSLFAAKSWGYGGYLEPGLNLYSYAGTAVPGAQANWNYRVPRFNSDYASFGVRPQSYIDKLTLSKVYWWIESGSAPYPANPFVMLGIWNEAKNWWENVGVRTGTDGQMSNATINISNPNHVTDVKEGGVVLAADKDTTSRSRHLWVGQASVEVTDNDYPSIGFTQDTDWLNESASDPIDFTALDKGLGVYAMLLKYPRSGASIKQTSQLFNCVGNASTPCPREWEGHLSNFDPKVMPQGENVVELIGQDPIGHFSDQMDLEGLATVKVDRTAPDLALSGSLAEQEKVGTTASQYTLKYIASDGDHAEPVDLPQIGSAGTGEGQMQRPMGVAVDSSGNVWVVDRENNRVQKFDETGKLLLQFGTTGTANGQFKDPRGIAIGTSGNVYVSEVGNKRVQVFNSKGEYLRKITYASFVEPYGLAVGPGETLWVADTWSHQIYRFNEAGVALDKAVGSPSSPTGEVSLKSPVGLASDPNGNVWVVDNGNHFVQKFNSTGKFLFQFGSAGNGNENLKNPVDIDIAKSGNLLITDGSNNRVVVFQPSGVYQRQFGSVGTGSGELSEPRGIAVGPGNTVVIADAGNKRVSRWNHADYDPQSGAAGTEVKVDGQLVEPKHSPGCATRDCTISREWMLNADQFSVGQHTLQVTATDGVGLSTSKSMTIETHGDLTPPAVALSGSMTEQATLGTTRPAYTLKVSATDPGSAEERKSGVAGTTVKVDGATVDATSPGCPGGGCSITREWTLSSNSYSVGDHSVQVTATDAAGRVTTKSLTITINRDTTPPQLTASNAFFTAPEGWLEQKSYFYTPSGTDAGGYGVTSLELKIDGTVVNSTTQTCAAGGCSASIGGIINMTTYKGGSHPAELVAKDAAGNTSKKTWTINVNPKGDVPSSEAISTLDAADETSESEVVAPTAEVLEPGQIEGGDNPGLKVEGETIESTGVPNTTTMTTDPSDGFVIESPEGETSITPVIPGESEPVEVAEGVAAVSANPTTGIDTVVRPQYNGAMTFQTIREAVSPETYSWDVKLAGNQQLQLIDEQHAQVVYENGLRAFLIVAEEAHDATGATVPTSITVSGNTLTLHVPHKGKGFVYPVIAGQGWETSYEAPIRVEMPPTEQEEQEEAESSELPPAPTPPLSQAEGERIVKARMKGQIIPAPPIPSGGATVSKIRDFPIEKHEVCQRDHCGMWKVWIEGGEFRRGPNWVVWVSDSESFCRWQKGVAFLALVFISNQGCDYALPAGAYKGENKHLTLWSRWIIKAPIITTHVQDFAENFLTLKVWVWPNGFQEKVVGQWKPDILEM